MLKSMAIETKIRRLPDTILINITIIITIPLPKDDGKFEIKMK